ncbi:outer membrane protein assembly factor BamB family protein [Halorubellus salinus]|uniref:outer membrane protein assembly factor BamB family protein n=1 Tax=Halorubellus salinus TaxID=755309 RepID=UPI001D09579A|nr:PQQ-binding-like beta-propeller repeat protein [Halorubellus salinus]
MPPSPPPEAAASSRSSAQSRERTVSRRALVGAAASATAAGLAGCLGTGTTTDVTDAPWPMQGYDAGRTNHRADANPPRGDLAVAWRTDLPGHWPLPRQPVAYDDLVVAPNDGLLGLGRADGSERFALHPTRVGLAVAAADGYRTPTLVAGGDRVVLGLDAAGGVDTRVGERVAERWHVGDEDTGPFAGGLLGGGETVAGRTPVAADGVVYHASAEGAVVSRDAASGRERWRAADERGARFFAVDEHLYVAEHWMDVGAYDLSTGERVWTHEGGDVVSRHTAGVAATDGTVFVNDGRGITALDATDGGVRWRTSDGERVDVETSKSVPTVTDDTVVLPGYRAVHGFDRETGARVWKRALDPTDPRHVAAAGDLAFVPTEGGELVALQAATGRTAWEFRPREAWEVGPPVVADGRLYAVAGNTFVCLEGSR